jgi:hypothetical protein
MQILKLCKHLEMQHQGMDMLKVRSTESLKPQALLRQLRGVKVMCYTLNCEYQSAFFMVFKFLCFFSFCKNITFLQCTYCLGVVFSQNLRLNFHYEMLSAVVL